MKRLFMNLKKTALVLGFGLIGINAFGQLQVDNSGFENWDQLGNDKERPVNWNNMKNGNLCGLCGLGSKQTTWRDAEVRPGSSGNYSAKVKSSSALGNIINGNMTLGQLNAPSTTPSQGFNLTVRNNAQFNQPFTGKPDSLVIWAKYSITSSSDSARVSATIHDDYDYRDPEDASSAPHAIARAVKNFQTNGQWVRLSIPFVYVNNALTPSYILVTIASSYSPGVGVNGATLLVDDLEMIYNPKVDIASTADQNLFVYENGTQLTATETNGTVVSRQWKYATTAGGPYTNSIAGATNATYTPMFTTPGTYYVVCESDFGSEVVTSNEVKVVVSDFTASIAPTAIQNILTGQSGNTLTVTENATGATREWKYSTTQGSGYVSFAIAQTGTTYTPSFATAGTYYVVCESTLFGNTVTSNEVKVVVSDFTASIAPTAIQNILTGQSGNTLTVTENATGATREWKYSTTQGSGYVSFAIAQTGTTYTPSFATAGTYYVVCESTLFGNTVTSNEVQINVTDPISYSVAIAPNAVQNLIENQDGDLLTASEVPSAASSREWKYSTISGSGYVSFATAETGVTYTPNFATAGTYYVVCVSDFAGDIQTSNEVQINVAEFTNSIAPVAIQDLLENEDGDDLTVTESVTVDSREWKYSTTSGSGYVSFATAETGATYTPNFATAGTYYVVCESTVGTFTTTSNEVQINVAEFTNSIAPVAIQDLLENEDGDDLTVTESVTVDSREWKYSTTSGSGYVSFATAETGATYTPNFATAGTYYVVCESTVGTFTTTSNEVQINVTEDVVASETVTIAPTTTQDLLEGEIGTELTATESTTPDSREWKVSMTSGSGYISFGQPQTNSTYTPVFATEGVYYVVCESDFGGNVVISNEVRINVTKEVSVKENGLASVKVYGVNQTVKVDFSEFNTNATIQIFAANGQLISTQSLNANQINEVELNVVEGIYFFVIQNDTDHFTGKVLLQ